MGITSSNSIFKFVTIAANPIETPISRFGQIRRGIEKAQELEKKNHNLKLSGGRRIDLKGRHPLSKGHYNKITKEQLDYPHVHDPKYPGGVRMPNANDYIEIFKLFK